MKPTGIILAGGKSSRMGQEKGLVELGGKRLIDIAIENLSKVCETILISSNGNSFNDTGFQVIKDVEPGIGPMGGLYSALLHSKTALNLVLSVDLPFVNEGLLKHLIESSKGYQAAVPWSGQEHYEPLCACYDLSILPLMEASVKSGNYKLPDLFRLINLNPLPIEPHLPFYHEALFMNINTKDDLNAAQKLINSI
ncbi:MAG: molybdenum cofactor guanylyltransferase [Bacteroidales bacterium]|nr:molybdenum cofactor guanylyltransferase [Bacteroidales bacterium]